MIKPYTDSTNIRTFSKDVDPIELVWHQDAEDRDIEILEGKGWQMQFDNELPFDIGKGDRIFITEGQVHRVLKGKTDLKIKIN
jgi:quercetin dioxygenase-like cupin family protein